MMDEATIGAAWPLIIDMKSRATDIEAHVSSPHQSRVIDDPCAKHRPVKVHRGLEVRSKNMGVDRGLDSPPSHRTALPLSRARAEVPAAREQSPDRSGARPGRDLSPKNREECV